MHSLELLSRVAFRRVCSQQLSGPGPHSKSTSLSVDCRGAAAALLSASKVSEEAALWGHRPLPFREAGCFVLVLQEISQVPPVKQQNAVSCPGRQDTFFVVYLTA